MYLWHERTFRNLSSTFSMVFETVQQVQVAFEGSSVSVSLQTPVFTMNSSKTFWGRCKQESINYQNYIFFKTDVSIGPNSLMIYVKLKSVQTVDITICSY